MKKAALKRFATAARIELLERVELRARKFGITIETIQEKTVVNSDDFFINGKPLTPSEKVQRNKLISRIGEISFDQVMDEVAYTWFNRFTALRFMEVNDYLPSKVRVLSSNHEDSNEPEMIKEALSLDLDLDKEYVYDLRMNNKTEELFKYLIIKHCNDLNKYMPFMFEKIDDYTEILFPDELLSPDSFLRQMSNVEVIPESNWEEIEVIGWLYQYYNTEINELVYDGNMSKSRITKELLPAATQLFTPDWAVKYMVENSLGRLWLEGHSNDDLKGSWKYYLDHNEVESNMHDQNEKLKNMYKHINPEDIKIIDPAMGSGHILVYAFDILMQIYESRGYLQRDAAKLILQKNLYGLEIDYRAYQLASFAVVMKARKYNRRILSENIELNLSSIEESNWMKGLDLNDINIGLEDKDIKTFNYLITVFEDAKEYGSILNVEKMDYESLQNSLDNMNQNKNGDLFHNQLLIDINEIIPTLIKQAKVMIQKYDVVITNPPYLGSSRMSTLLNEYVKSYYPTTKSDLSTVMYEKAINSYSKPAGFVSFITTNSWFFLKSFEKFREKVLKTVEFSSLIDFGTELFDGKVGHNPIVAWVNRNSTPQNEIIAIRLVDFRYSRRNEKENEYFNLENRYYPNQENFSKIPGSPIAYWLSDSVINTFSMNRNIGESSLVRKGMFTGNNNKYIRFWFETDISNIGFSITSLDEAFTSGRKWFPTKKGGGYRKWYGNDIEVVAMDKTSYKEIELAKGHRSPTLYFQPSISWSSVTSGSFSCRYSDYGFINNTASMSLFYKETDFTIILSLLNSKLITPFLNELSPTLNFTAGDLERIPLVSIDESNVNKLKDLASSNIRISKIDWDSLETSWDFQKHPLLKYGSFKIELAFSTWLRFTVSQFSELKSNEEELNRIFIDIYGLQSELAPEVADKDITIYKADLERDIRSFISYAIGCSFGRYSLDEVGLIYAGGEFDPTRYETLQADEDNILPILPGAYFEDDIVSRFVDFVRVTFGEESLEENLEFVADAIKRRKNETARETLRRYFMNDFYKEHVQTYKKRPIYWQFTSGKEKAFNCLIYMHRYDKTTLSRIRTDYLHEYQIRLDVERQDLVNIIDGDYTTKEINDAKRELKSLDKKITELKDYDEVLHHMADMQIEIDLDDGVKVNYEKFDGLVAKI